LPAIILKKYLNEKTSEDGFTALHFASYRGNLAMMEFLIAKGAGITLLNNHGMNVLHIGAQGD
jgi:palmitoyltransferase